MSAAVVTAIYAALSIFVAWQVTIALFVFAVGAALAMARFFRKMSVIGQRLAPLNAAYSHSGLIENFTGAKYIKAARGVDRATEYTERLVRKLEKATVTAS